MDFLQAEEKFNELQARVQRGEPLSEDQYQEELAKLMVQDEHGTFWSLEPGTGRWLYFDGTEWVPGTPPRMPARPATAPAVSATPAPTDSMSSVAGDLAQPAESSGVEPENVQTYVRAGEGESPADRPGGIPPRPTRDATYTMGMEERPWLPFAIGAVVLLLCAIVLFFGVRNAPFFGAAAAKTTPTATEQVEPTATEVMVVPTDTPQPSPTKVATTPTPSIVKATTTENVRARSGPGTSYGVLTTLQKGTTVTVVSRNADSSWLQVRLADG
ncbi:MAG: SH3 domain-containing protein, partial [Anaerolineae bacterium]